MKRMYVGNLSPSTKESDVTKLFEDFGTVRGVKLVNDVFSGKCRGFGFVEMEGHEARAAIAGLDGSLIDGRPLKVRLEDDQIKSKGGKKRKR